MWSHKILVPCEDCGETFVNPEEYIKHIIIYHSPPRRPLAKQLPATPQPPPQPPPLTVAPPLPPPLSPPVAPPLPPTPSPTLGTAPLPPQRSTTYNTGPEVLSYVAGPGVGPVLLPHPNIITGLPPPPSSIMPNFSQPPPPPVIMNPAMMMPPNMDMMQNPVFKE